MTLESGKYFIVLTPGILSTSATACNKDEGCEYVEVLCCLQFSAPVAIAEADPGIDSWPLNACSNTDITDAS
jgi:hypothetical protein